MNNKKTIGFTISIVAFFSLSYAILRYNIFGPVPWKDLPLYILNKAISFTAIILFTINSFAKYINKSKNIDNKVDHKKIESTIFSLILIHLLISLMLFNPEVYPKFFEENKTVNFSGGFSMLAAIVAFIFFTKLKLFSNIFNNSLKAPNYFPFIFWLLILLHLFFMGYQSWFTPDKWYGGLPPISLLSFVIGVFGLLLRIRLLQRS